MPWDDPTAGLADGSSDVAVAWPPLPGRVRTPGAGREPVAVALPHAHALAARTSMAFADLLDEPFLALPAEAGPLRAGWLAEEHRGGRPVRVGAEVRSMEETHEALLDGRGVVLLAAGNADALTRGASRWSWWTTCRRPPSSSPGAPTTAAPPCAPTSTRAGRCSRRGADAVRPEISPGSEITRPEDTRIGLRACLSTC